MCEHTLKPLSWGVTHPLLDVAKLAGSCEMLEVDLREALIVVCFDALAAPSL
jgi:hypothetical protein